MNPRSAGFSAIPISVIGSIWTDERRWTRIARLSWWPLLRRFGTEHLQYVFCRSPIPRHPIPEMRSKSTEGGIPVFSALSLAEFAKSNAVLTLVKNKDETVIDAGILRDLEVLLTSFGGDRIFRPRGSYSDYRRRFESTMNKVGRGTLRTDAVAFLGYHE